LFFPSSIRILKIELLYIDNICSSPSSPVVPSSSNVPLCPPAPPSIPFPYGQYGQSAPAMINSLGGWIMNPSMQSIPQMFHPIFNPHQQYGKS
jgi:hypothetical protein